MIKEAHCSYEVSKLLKKKGMNKEYFTYYIQKNNIDGTSEAVTTCTHQMAMAWLREQYDLHIIAFPYKANDNKKWCCQVYKIFNLLGCEKYINETLDSYEEAVEEALKYVLTNLI